MGCARDIVENAAVPRFWFSNFPLGHSAGKPHDRVSQHDTLHGALELFESASKTGTTVTSPQRWGEDDGWEKDFWDLSQLSAADINRLQQAHERVRRTAADIKRK